MGATMCKEVSPGAGVEGRGGTLATSGGCRDSVDRALERILRRKSQVINGTNVPSRSSALKNGSPLGSPTATGPFLFVDKGKSPPPRIAMKGPRSPPIRDTHAPFASNPTRAEESPVMSPVRDEPPVRPPRRKDRMRRANLAVPRRNQSAISLPSQAAIPQEAAARLEMYLKRCHSMGTIPVLLEELRASAHVSSISTLSSSSLDSSQRDLQVQMGRADDRLPSFASDTPPPSPSSTPPEEANASPRLPRFFIGSRGRSVSPSSVQGSPSPMNPYSDMWGDGSRRGASSIISSTTEGGSTRRRHQLKDDGDNMHDLIRKLRRVRSHTGPERPEVHHHHHHHKEKSGRSSVEPLNEHVIDLLPTRAHPPNLTLNRVVSSPQIATSGPQSLLGPEADRNNPRSILLRILGEYQCLPGSGALSRSGKKGEEEELAALEKQLEARWAYIGKRKTRVAPKKREEGEEREDGKEGEEGEEKKEKGEDDDSSSSTSVTPSLGELEEALAQMLDEDDWEEREEERVNKEAEYRAKQVAEVRLKLGGEGGGSLMSLKMKRENTFTALSALSKDE